MLYRTTRNGGDCPRDQVCKIGLMPSCCDQRVDAAVGFVDAGDLLVEVEGCTGGRGGGGEDGDARVVTVGLVSVH